ncbi:MULTISPECIES: hypothetical protein [unclassified Streptococcus]|uniref:hypothetical protein n=1 Tax=unclassified Streptococcus TaxID=2608887 RepID=UPI00359DE2C9
MLIKELKIARMVNDKKENAINIKGAVHEKTFSLGANNNTRVINFQPVKAQYLRLTALESWANNLPARSGVVTAAQFIPSCVKLIEETPQV